MRLIDADAYIKYCDDHCVPMNIYAVNAQPTVDAIPVVRCKDCKHAHMTYDGECKYCDIWSEEGEMYLPGDFYCACGERKGERKDDSN